MKARPKKKKAKKKKAEKVCHICGESEHTPDCTSYVYGKTIGGQTVL